MTRRIIGFVCTPMVGMLTLAACGGAGSPNGPTANLVIEGLITGLDGAGLVLQNNGGSDLTILPTDPGFVFFGIAEGSSYSITVKAQPASPTQTCLVSRGTGVANDAVRNVLVSCTTSQFSVRGTVTGLTGLGLALSLNGGPGQSIAPGGTSFAFPPMLSGSQYAVTVSGQPSGQTCVSSNGSGVVGGADVASVAIFCSAPGFTIGGTGGGLGREGLVLRLNGGTQLPVIAGALSFTFPAVLQTGTDYSVTVAATPLGPPVSCVLVRAKGRVGAANISDMVARCFANGNLAGYAGTYAIAVGGRRSYLTLWLDGTFSVAVRLDDVTCTNNGNGVEYGVYRRAADGAFSIYIAVTDRIGQCGLWSGGAVPTPGAGYEGTMVRTGNTLTLTSTVDDDLTFEAIASVPTSLVGSFTRTDGVDGSFIVFEADGSYLYQETQQSSGSNPNPAGYERGCYTVTASTFTTSLAASCQPNALPALDLNGTGGFSGHNGAPIPFTIVSPTAVTIGGVPYNRILPAG